jgi:hypothetical protein
MMSISGSNPMAGWTKGGRPSKLVFLSVTLGCAFLASAAQARGPGDERAAPTSKEPAHRLDDSSSLLRIEVAARIDDASLLPDWITSRNPDLAQEIPTLQGHEQWIAIDIAGATYDYRVSVVAMRDGKPVRPMSEPVECVCNSEKLLALVDDRIDEAVAELRAAKLADVTMPPEPEPTPPDPVIRPESEVIDDEEVDGHRRPLGALGYAGIAVGVLGVGALGAGIPLALRPDEMRGARPERERYSTHPPGIAMAVGGGVALATGVTLIIVDRVRHRRRSLAVLPTFGPGRVGLSITRSF